MGKFPTFPTLFDSALQLKASNLNKWGYLKPNQLKTGVLTWSCRGEKTGSISIKVNTIKEQPYIELDYTSNDEPRNYKVNIVSIPSNLGIAKVYYFECPQTKKRCRILYLIGGYFLHRDAFNGCYYESQLRSKYYRFLDNNYGAYFKSEHLYQELHKKHFKKYYAGKPTKRYLKIKAELDKADSIPYEEIERLYIS
jgi:hypothetical protein